MNTIKVVFWAYRDWAVNVWPTIEKHIRVSSSACCKTRSEVLALPLEEYDILITCGLSEEVGNEITERIKVIGAHCAELDRYSYGTPIQLQIIDGVRFSKQRIFSFTAGDNDSKRAHTHDRLYANETILDLTGNMEDILLQMTATSKVIFNMFLDEYPNNCWRRWPEENIIRGKRVQKDSRITQQEIAQMNTKQLYNFFRCLEFPYPNGYIEDDEGYLYIQSVRFKEK